MDVRGLFHRGRRLSVAVVVAAALAAVASIAPSSFAVAAAAAQTTGATTATIRGTVTDATGGVLPGVTVTVTSPALQVPNLTALTDETGAYRFIDLRPGVYQVTYQLEGFRIVVRENQRLSAGFVAQIDQGLSVSTVAESVVVSGASPVVDVASTGGGTSFSKEVLQQAPVALTMWQVLALSPGIRMTGAPDVGGNTVGTQQGFANYGTSGQVKPELDGMDTREQTGSAGSYYDDRSFEEVQVRAYGHDAEMALPGVNYVAVVKSGGNELHGTYHGAFQHRRLQSTNLDDDLRAQGLTIGNPIDWYWDAGADLGGRIIRDKLWFYGAYRNHGTRRGIAGFAANPGADGIYRTSDDVAGSSTDTLANYTSKVSYQPSRAFRANVTTVYVLKRTPERDAGAFRPLESTYDFRFPTLTSRGEVQGMPNDRIVWNVLVGRHEQIGEFYGQEDAAGRPSRFDRTTQMNTGPHAQTFRRVQGRWMGTGSVSLFPGAVLGTRGHVFKAGVRATRDWFGEEYTERAAGNYQLTTDNGQAAEILFNNAPIDGHGSRMTELSAYVKDDWKVSNRFTANIGVRWERYRSFVIDQEKRPDLFGLFPSGSIPGVDVLTWNAVAPRVGVAFDVTGDGRTVAKGTFGWYNHTMANVFANPYNKNFNATARFRWRDRDDNGDYTPGEVNLDLNGPDFVSISAASNTIINADLEQPATYEVSASLERELAPDLAGRVLYVYRRQVRQFGDVNALRPYSAYNIPITRRDPGPDGALGTGDDGGSVTMYDYDAAYRGAAFVGTTRQTSDREDGFHTIEATATKRFSRKWDLTSSVSATKNQRWLTLNPQSPNDEFFPLDDTWSWQAKVVGGYELPYRVRVSGFLQYLSGQPLQRTNVFRSADPDGGPPLAQLATVNLRLEPYGDRRQPDVTVVNVRVAKRWGAGARTLDLEVDLHNALNANTATSISNVSGPTFGNVTDYLPPRVARFGVTFGF